MNLRVPQNAENFLTSLEPVSFSRRTLLYGVSEYSRNTRTAVEHLDEEKLNKEFEKHVLENL